MSVSPSGRFLLAACLAGIGLLLPITLLAETPAKARSLPQWVAELGSHDVAQVTAAIDALSVRNEAAAVLALGAFVRAGQPDALADRALAALGKTRSQKALPILAEFIQHRRKSARLSVYGAIAELPGEPANALIARGLRDSEAEVRGLCARVLGERGAREQVDVLFRALGRGVAEAGAAVGRLGDSAAIARFDAHLAQLPIQVMLAGYEQFLLRSDIDAASKLAIVARLGEVASVTVKHFLAHLADEPRLSKELKLVSVLRETAGRIDDRSSP